MPIQGGQILLPSAMIAEVTYYIPPEQVSETSPDWFLGIIPWRHQQVPLLSLERVFSLPEKMAPTTTKLRTVVLYGLDAVAQLPFYAIIANEIPRTVNITENNLTVTKMEVKAGLMFTVNITKEEVAWVPDITYLENLLRKSTLNIAGSQRNPKPVLDSN